MHEIDVHPLSLTAEDIPFASPQPLKKVLLHTPSGILGSHTDGWVRQLSSTEGWPWTLLPVVGDANQFYLQCPLGYMGWLGQGSIRANAPLSEQKVFEFMPAPEAADAFVLRMKDPGGTYHDRYVRCKADNWVDLVVDQTLATRVHVHPLQQVTLQTPTGVLGTDTASWGRFDQQSLLWSLLPIAGSAGQYHLHGEKGYLTWGWQGANPHVATNGTMTTRKIVEFVPVAEAADTMLLRVAQPGDAQHGKYVQQRSDHWAILTADRAQAARLTRTVVNVDTAIDTLIRHLAISEDELDILLQEGPTPSSALGLPPAYLLNLGYHATIKKQKSTPTAVQPRWKLVRDGQALDDQTLQRMEMLVLLQRQMAISYRQLDELFAIALRLDDPDKILTTVALLRMWQLAGADFTSWYQWLTTSNPEHSDMMYRLMTMALLPSLKLSPQSIEGPWLRLLSHVSSLDEAIYLYTFIARCQQQEWEINWVVETVIPGKKMPWLETEAYHTRIQEWKVAMQLALVTPSAIQSQQLAQVNRLLKELDSSLSPIDWWALCMNGGATMDTHGLIKLTQAQLATFSLSTQLNAHPTIQALIAKGSPEAKDIQELLRIEQRAIENYIKQSGEQQHNALIKLTLHDALPNEFMTPILNWVGFEHYSLMLLLLKESGPTDPAIALPADTDKLLVILYELHKRIEFLKTLSLKPTFLNKLFVQPTLLGLNKSDLSLMESSILSLASLDKMVQEQPAQWEAAVEQGLPMNTTALLLGVGTDELTRLVLALGGTEVVRNLGECLHIHKLIQLSEELQIPALTLVWIFNARNGESTMSELAASALRDTMQLRSIKGNNK